jgi:hypothetical protein
MTMTDATEVHFVPAKVKWLEPSPGEGARVSLACAAMGAHMLHVTIAVVGQGDPCPIELKFNTVDGQYPVTAGVPFELVTRHKHKSLKVIAQGQFT